MRSLRSCLCLFHANSYLAIRVSIDGNEEHGSAPGSCCSDDTPGSYPAFIALTTGFHHRGIQAPWDGRLLVGLSIAGKKGKALLEHPDQGKSQISHRPQSQLSQQPRHLETLGPRSTSHLNPHSKWVRCKSLPAPCLTAHRRQRYLCIPKSFEKQVVILPALFKMETVLFPSLGLQSSLHDFGWQVPCNPP